MNQFDIFRAGIDDPNDLPEDPEAERIIEESLTDQVCLNQFLDDARACGEDTSELRRDLRSELTEMKALRQLLQSQFS